MIKTILFVQRKPGLSVQEFRDYYESRHAVLAGKTMAHCVRYTRNYPVESVGADLGWDVITEFWFDLDGPWSEVHGEIVTAARAAVLEADELQFMDRPSMRVSVVEEYESPASQLTAPAVGAAEEGER